ncbi:MAG: dephospho-CoA kinase [Bacteroidota bacterium]
MPHYALTGNIGAGKSTVAQLFAPLGIPTYSADAAAKRLMTEDTLLVSAIKQQFGDRTYFEDGQLNRKYLAEKAFTNTETATKLNALVHPAVHRDALRWQKSQAAPYTLYEAAIVLELGRQDQFAGVIVVSCPEFIRQERVMARDGSSAEQFAARAAQQWTDQEKEAAADFIIVNDGKQLLLPQVLKLHRILSRSASSN